MITSLFLELIILVLLFYLLTLQNWNQWPLLWLVLNDFWKIKFSENEPHLIVTVYDRYGKLIQQFGSSSQGWDGNYLGKPLPSSDYWFVVTRENGKEFKGHFTLKR